MNISRDSWLHKLYVFGYFTDYGKVIAKKRANVDACTLVRRLLIGSIKLLVLLSLILSLLIAIGLLIYEIGIFPFIFSIGAGVGIIAIIGLVLFSSTYISNWIRTKQFKTPDNKVVQLISTYYKSFKEKTCPLIKVDGENDDF